MKRELNSQQKIESILGTVFIIFACISSKDLWPLLSVVGIIMMLNAAGMNPN